MDEKTAGYWNLVVSLVFAGLMIVASAIVSDPWKQTVVFWLIAAWWIPFSYFIGQPHCGGRCQVDASGPKAKHGESE